MRRIKIIKVFSCNHSAATVDELKPAEILDSSYDIHIVFENYR